MKVISEESEQQVRDEIQRVQKAYDDTVRQYTAWRSLVAPLEGEEISVEKFEHLDDVQRGYKHCLSILVGRSVELMEELQEMSHYHTLALSWSQVPDLPRA